MVNCGPAIQGLRLYRAKQVAATCNGLLPESCQQEQATVCRNNCQTSYVLLRVLKPNIVDHVERPATAGTSDGRRFGVLCPVWYGSLKRMQLATCLRWRLKLQHRPTCRSFDTYTCVTPAMADRELPWPLSGQIAFCSTCFSVSRFVQKGYASVVTAQCMKQSQQACDYAIKHQAG